MIHRCICRLCSRTWYLEDTLGLKMPVKTTCLQCQAVLDSMWILVPGRGSTLR